MSVRKKHVDPVRQREGAESIQKSENGTGSEDLHRGTGVNQSASVSCTDISKRQNNGKFTITLSIDPDVLESMLESTADDLLKVFHTSHERNESEMNTKRCIKRELQNLTDSLRSPGGIDQSSKQPHQSQSQPPEPYTVTINDQEVNKETFEPHVNCQIGIKRSYYDSVDTSGTPAKIPRNQATKSTSRSSTKSVKKPKNQKEDYGSGGMQSFTPISIAGPSVFQKSCSDKKTTLELQSVPLRKQESGSKPQDNPTLPRRLIPKTTEDKTNITTPIKPSEHSKSQKRGRKRKWFPSMKTKESSARRKSVLQSRCTKKENLLYHKTRVEKPIENKSDSIDQIFKKITESDLDFTLSPRVLKVAHHLQTEQETPCSSKQCHQQLSGTIIGTNSSLRDSHSSGYSSSSTQPTQQAQCSPKRITNSEKYPSSRDSHHSEDIDNITHVQLTQQSQQSSCSSVKNRQQLSEIDTGLFHNSEPNLNSGDNCSRKYAQQSDSGFDQIFQEITESDLDFTLSPRVLKVAHHLQTEQQTPCFSMQCHQQLSRTIIGTNLNLRDSHASEGGSSTQPVQQAPCSHIRRLTNLETYSTSRDSDMHFSEDIDNSTQPSHQFPCSSVKNQQQIDMELSTDNISEMNLSSRDNYSSQHGTIKQPQLTQQAPPCNEVHSELSMEDGDELPDTSATTRNSDSGSKEDFHSQIDKALKDARVKIITAKCGVFGPPETGKSHFKALVCGKKRPKTRQSTAIAEDAVQMTNITDFEEQLLEMHRTRDGSNVRWFVTDNKKLALLVAKTMYDRKNPISLSADKKRQMSKTRKILLENMKTLARKNLTRNPKRLKGMTLIYLVDTGGQPQFQEILPMFVRSSSVHFLVHKLNESLDERPRFDYVVDGVKYSVPEEMLVSNKVYLQQSLRTISSCNFSCSSHTKVSKPQFAVIGMFKDKCDDDLIDAKQRAVNECIAPFTQSKKNEKNKCVAITPSRHTEKPIFAIDGSEKGWSTNGDMIDKIHICIENFTKDLEVEIPVRWFLFLNALKEESTSQSFLKLQACYKLAKDEDILMDEEDVDEALELFDELNLVLHFHKFLRNVVFVSTKFLLEKVTKILVQSFDCSSDNEDITPEEQVKFRQTGIINISTIKRVKCFEKDFHDPFKLDDLFELLENLCIFSKVSIDRYFVPCVLALEKDGVNSSFLRKFIQEMCTNKVEPLVISFSDDYSPRGLFCATITYLSKRQNWEIESDSRTLERKRNLIEFNYLQEKEAVSLGSVVIVDRMTRFEVYSNCNPDHLRGIRRTVDKALEYAVINCLDYSPENVDIGIGFECDMNCDMPKPHGTWIDLEDDDNPQWLNKCIKNKSKHAKKLNEKQRPWFFSSESEVAGNLDSSKELSLSLLMDEVASETNKWWLIAIQLKFKSVLIERIETEQRSILMCFQKVFTTWKRQGNPPYTWQVIIDALNSPSVGEHSLAETLRRQYIHVA